MIPADSSSVAAAIRSSIFCCWLPEIWDGAGLRRVIADAGFSASGDGRRPGRPACAEFRSLHQGFWAAGREGLGSNCAGHVLGRRFGLRQFPTTLSRRGFGRGRSVVPGFFRIGIRFLKFASGFGMEKDIRPINYAVSQADTSETMVPLEPCCTKLGRASRAATASLASRQTDM